MTNGDHEGYNDVTDHTCSAASVRLFVFHDLVCEKWFYVSVSNNMYKRSCCSHSHAI